MKQKMCCCSILFLSIFLEPAEAMGRLSSLAPVNYKEQSCKKFSVPVRNHRLVGELTRIPDPMKRYKKVLSQPHLQHALFLKQCHQLEKTLEKIPTDKDGWGERVREELGLIKSQLGRLVKVLSDGGELYWINDEDGFITTKSSNLYSIRQLAIARVIDSKELAELKKPDEREGIATVSVTFV